jgi:hypothetical protein
MEIELVPMLRVERDLYDIPRGWARFRRYLEVVTGGTQDMVLPLTLLNPMGKEHVAAALDALLGLDAEAVAAAAVDDARRRLAQVPGELRVGLVVADDVGGGWTNRYLTEATHRFDNEEEPKRGWAVALFWTSEAPTRERVRAEVLAAIYRTRYLQRHGLPRTLRQMMDQEGLAAVFAEIGPPALEPMELASIRAVIDPHRDSAHFPTVFACLYGDEAARAVGYPALGLPPRAGYALAIEEARQRRAAPEATLLGMSG